MAIDPRIIPTAARTINLANHIPPGSYGIQTSALEIRLPNRRTLDVVDWWLDCSLLLAQYTDDAIVDIVTLVSPSGTAGDMTAADVAVVGQYAGIMLAGGRDGQTYTVTVTVTSSSGRTLSVQMVNVVAGTGLSPGASGSTDWPIAASTAIRIKRGETLVVQITALDDDDAPLDLVNAVLTAQARTPLGDLVADLPIEQTAEPSVATIEAPTDLWPLGPVNVDFRALIGEQVAYSETVTIHVDRPVTT